MGRVSYKVKNTIVQFGASPEDAECAPVVDRHHWGDVAEELQKGVASAKLQLLRDVPEFVPAHCGAYAMPAAHEDLIPATPSPLMHPSVLPEGMADVMAFGADTGLPPAFDSSADGFQNLECLAGLVDQDMNDVCIPAMAYDPNTGWCSGWCVPVHGNYGGMQQGQDGSWDCLGQECLDPQQQELTQEQLQQQEELLQEHQDAIPQVCQDGTGHDFEDWIGEGNSPSEESNAGWQLHEEEAWPLSPSKGSSKADRRPGKFTTVMLRNVPNKYTREMLVEQLTQDFRGRFDFVYLPIDFKNGCNIGYGFINFRTVEACNEFVQAFDGVDVSRCLPGLHSKKVAEVTPARVQGLEENVRRLRSSPVMGELSRHPEWMPLLLDKDGEERAFPQPEQPVPPVRPRGRRSREAWAGGAGAEGGRGGGWRR